MGFHGYCGERYEMPEIKLGQRLFWTSTDFTINV
jgi:hypothetical protein